MTDKWKALFQNKSNLIMIVLAGILLMIIALPVKKNSKDNTSYSNDRGVSPINASQFKNSEGMDTAVMGGANAEIDAYAREMEDKLEDILSKMEGAGHVEVIITIKSSTERIVEKDLPVIRSNTQEEDGEGGTRNINNVDTQESTVFSQNGSISEPYVVQTISPRVEGVLVLAQGANSGMVNKNITDAIQVLFGIEAHRIKVIKMNA